MGCVAISAVENSMVRNTIESFSQSNDFTLFANYDPREIFIAYKNLRYIKNYLPLNENIDDVMIYHHQKRINCLANATKFLLETMHVSVNELIRIYIETPIIFDLLSPYSWPLICVKENLVHYNELASVPGRLLDNGDIYWFIKSGISLDDVKLAFKNSASYVIGMRSLYRPYSYGYIGKTAEMMRAEIKMLLNKEPDDKSIYFGKLDEPDTSVNFFAIDNSRGSKFSGKDIQNLLYNFPKLQDKPTFFI